MIWRFYRAIGRHHRAVLAGGTGLAVACMAAELWAPDVAARIMPAVIYLIWLLAALLAVTFVATWLGTGIELRPDGVHERLPLGYQFVPWEALPATRVADDHPGMLRVNYGRPELVRRRGLTFGRGYLRYEAVHPLFASDTIRYYATQPEERPAIGTVEGYERLRQVTGFNR